MSITKQLMLILLECYKARSSSQLYYKSPSQKLSVFTL